MKKQILGSIGARVGLAIAIILILMQAAILILNSSNTRDQQIASEVHAARNLILMAESVRQNMERKWELGLFSPQSLRSIQADTPKERKAKILATVPVVAAWESAKAKAKEGGFEFRTPRVDARNPDNNPDFVEQDAIKHFQANPKDSEYYVIDPDMNAVRYFRPVRLGEVCMNCHGDPATSQSIWGRDDGRDITGFKMDGKKVGDLHGTFEVIRPLAQADAQIQSSLIVGTVETLIALLVMMLLVGWLIKRLVTRPVSNALSNIAMAEQNNDLTLQLDESGCGEVAQLSRAFNRFTARLRTFMGEVVGASGQLATAADQLSGITQTTNSAVNEQQAETQHVATAMEEMTATVAEVAQSAAAAADAANAANTETEHGEQVVAASRENIAQLANEVSATSEVIAQLESDSEAIGSILDVIRSIAEQTNLLALNAAIEAARAGEQGRGFAVVADEVRTLAQRTQKSTAEIQAMIEKLQNGAQNAVSAMNRGQEQAQQSVDQAQKASEALSAIADAINTINGMNTQIATAAEEQNAVAAEVNRNICNISQGSEQTVATATDLDHSADELKHLAVQLQDMVGKFRV